MKKMMFNDRYGLTDAVLQGRKTVTRRMVKPTKQRSLANCLQGIKYECMVDENENTYEAPYYVGEIVAVAQSYFDIWSNLVDIGDSYTYHGCKGGFINAINYHYKGVHHSQLSGWANKMFVRANLMPHQIRILDVRAERLQDINEKDCLAEGIRKEGYPFSSYDIGNGVEHSSAINAFKELIKIVCGKTTWEVNPFVWRIEFELIK